MKKVIAVLAVLAGLASMQEARAQSSTTISVQQIAVAGLTYSSRTVLVTTTSYIFNNDGRMFVRANKSGAGSAVFTFVTQASAQGFNIAESSVTVVATIGDKLMGPFSPSLFNDANGNVWFTVDDTAGLSFQVLRL